MLYIRADGNAEIGTGHIMRCLAIARASASLGEECTFITADRTMEPLIEENGFSLICLDSVWNDLDKETGKMVDLIKQEQIQQLLLDSYFVTPFYMRSLCATTRVIYIDDVDSFHYPCHMLINYNIYAVKFDYPEKYPDTQLLLSCEYAPLREEFQNIPARTPRQEVQSVLITTGGADPFNIAMKILKTAKKNPILAPLRFHVVAGRFHSHIQDLQELEKRYDGIVIHRNIKEMSRLMLDCDIAVSAGGSTTYELCACGTPCVVFSFADNQLDIVARFSDKLMLSAGDVRSGECEFLENITANIQKLAQDYTLRCELTKKMQNLIDGLGAERIAKNIKRFIENV